MKEQINCVQRFHTDFEVPIRSNPGWPAQNEECLLRYRLMEEENREYLEAVQSRDLVAVADALGDMLYILCGTIISHGMQEKMEAVFNEIHRSNMSKLGEDGKPLRRQDGKVIKGPQYSPPELEQILQLEKDEEDK